MLCIVHYCVLAVRGAGRRVDNCVVSRINPGERMNVYCISGLGADRRAFQKIILPPPAVIHHLDWIPPHRNETMNGYAKRLSEAIDQSQPFALIGLSFGGMVAAAMNDYVRPEKTILISSVPARSYLPYYFRAAGLLHLYNLIPASLLNKPHRIAYWLFGARTATDKTLLGQIMITADPWFMQWAIRAILTWKESKKPDRLVHIHGDRDKILPLRFTKPDVVIKNGSHFMVWTKGAELSRLLTTLLS